MQHSPIWLICDEVLHYVWDPIGVCGEPGARDEYSSYVPQVVHLLEQGADVDAIERVLQGIASERMSLDSNPQGLTAAQILVRWRAWFADQDS